MKEMHLEKGHQTGRGLKLRAEGVRPVNENLVVESPFELRINGRSQVMVMASPRDLEALALGHCLSEGLIKRRTDITSISLGRDELPGVGPVYWADVEMSKDLARQARVRRVAPAATSCGLCGLETFRDLGRGIQPVQSGLRVELSTVRKLLADMEAGQEVYGLTGAAHAAALGAEDGEMVALAEDVGRHNALDKVIGSALASGVDLSSCLATVSGRISFEMALKAARAGLPLIASISAATALGRALCQNLGVTLLAFVREERATLLCHAQRVLLEGVSLAEAEPK